MRRNRILLAALALAVAVTAVVALREQAGPPPEPTAAPETSAELEPDRAPTGIVALDFADDRHGYAVRRVCRDGPADVCQAHLLATTDAFQPAEHRDLAPGVGGYLGGLTGFVVLGPQRLRVGAGPDQHYSGDGGRSWTRVEGEAAPVDGIPAGSRLERQCQQSRCVLRVVLPGSGQSAALRHPPALTDPRPLPVPARDGRWWVVGRAVDGRAPVVASSVDGRDWLVRELPAAPYAGWWQAGVAVAGNAVYVGVTGPGAEAAGSLLTLYRSGDGGASWARVQAGVASPSLTAALVVGADGEPRLLDRSGQTVTGTGGGREFRTVAAEQRLPKGTVTWTRGGYLAETPYEHLVSADGSTWTRLWVA
ncbi:hypothetical protein GCM10010452_69880 [Crossiella cryophila]|uniref:hypothetical protein n=1 Tax=Crossiella cryophila TaxID=43355 RepID=UPI0031E6076A